MDSVPVCGRCSQPTTPGGRGELCGRCARRFMPTLLFMDELGVPQAGRRFFRSALGDEHPGYHWEGIASPVKAPPPGTRPPFPALAIDDGESVRWLAVWHQCVWYSGDTLYAQATWRPTADSPDNALWLAVCGYQTGGRIDADEQKRATAALAWFNTMTRPGQPAKLTEADLRQAATTLRAEDPPSPVNDVYVADVLSVAPKTVYNTRRRLRLAWDDLAT